MKKNIPEIHEREGNEKIHSHNSGKGIRGFHSWEWTGTGIPAHPWVVVINFWAQQRFAAREGGRESVQELCGCRKVRFKQEFPLEMD